MKLTKTILQRAMWMARGTVTVVGLAVMLAVVLGVGTTALAAAPGDLFKLGKTNAVNVVSKLVGSVAGPSLQIDNNSKNADATALDLRVEAGKTPMRVDSATKVKNLNSDKLDGKDSAAFARADTPTYVSINGAATGPPPFDPSASNQASCDDGDRILIGGYFDLSDNGVAVASFGLVDAWRATVKRTDTSNATISIRASCLDFPPLRP